MEAIGAGELGPRRRPAWSIAAAILGWLIVGGTLLIYVLFVIVVEINSAQRPSLEDLGGLTAMAGMGVWSASFGGLLVITGRSRRANVASTWLKLWAKFIILVGIMLSVGIPLFLAGGLMLKPQFASRMELLTPFIVIGAFFLLVGLAAIVIAVVWGRRKRPPDVSHVFN